MALGLDHSLLLKRDKTLWVAGRGKYGQLGDEIFQITVDRTHFIKVVDGGAGVGTLESMTRLDPDVVALIGCV